MSGQKQEVLTEIQATTYLDSTDSTMLYSLLKMADKTIGLMYNEDRLNFKTVYRFSQKAARSHGARLG